MLSKVSAAKLRPVILPALACLLLCLLFLPIVLLYTRPAQELSISYRSLPLGPEGGYTLETKEIWEVFLQTGEERTVLAPDQYMQYTGLDYNGQTFYYSALIEQELPNAILVIGAGGYGISVFLDEALLYTNAPGSGDRIGDLTLPMLPTDATRVLSIPLPDGHKGKTLTIAQSTSPSGGEKPGYDSFIPLPDIVLYSEDSLTTQNAAQSFTSGVTITALALLGSAFLALMLFRTYLSQRADWPAFFLALFVFLLMLDQALRAPMFYQYFHNFDFWSKMQTLAVPMASAGLMGFIALHMISVRRIFAAGAAALQFLSCVFFLLHQSFFSGPLQSMFYDLPNLVSCAALTIVLLLCIWEWRAGNSFFTPLIFAAAIASAGYLLALLASSGLRSDVLQLLRFVRIDNLIFPLHLLRLLFLFSASCAALIDFLYQVNRIIIERTTLSLKEQMALTSYQELRSQVHETAILRHDIKKHLDMLSGLLSDGRTEQARNYLAQVTCQFQRLRPIFSSGHYLIDLIFNSRLALAQDLDIQIKLKRIETPPALPLNDTELSALLINALDNAIQAAARLPIGQRWIEIEQFSREHLFYIGLSNSTDTPVPAAGVHGAEENHGYGLTIMRRIVERHAGLIDHSACDGVFRLVLLLPVQPAESESAPAVSR